MTVHLCLFICKTGPQFPTVSNFILFDEVEQVWSGKTINPPCCNKQVNSYTMAIRTGKVPLCTLKTIGTIYSECELRMGRLYKLRV